MPLDSLNSLPIAALRLSPDVLSLLEKLGIAACGQLFELPRDALPARFGPDLLRRIRQALGELPETIVPERLAEPLRSAWETDWPVSDRRAVEAVFRQLLSRLADEQLTPRQAGVLELICALDTETAQVTIELKLSRPNADLGHLDTLFRLRCERQTWPGAVRRITLELSRIAALPARQSRLFEDEAAPSERAGADFADRVISRLGAEAVLRPRYDPDPMPERAWRWEAWRADSAREPSPRCPDGLSRRRPLRMCAHPIRLEVGSPSAAGIPREIFRDGRREPIRRAWGPERIAAGWWRGEDEMRDYYRVETASGSQLWIFRQRATENWFLQGVFC